MATKSKAKRWAVHNADLYKEDFCIVQVENGQWMCEKVAFAKTHPRYQGRPIEVVNPQGEWRGAI